MRKADTRDYDSNELLLLRVGHHIVRYLRKAGTASTEKAILWEAAGLVWECKQQYRAEQAQKRAQAFTRPSHWGQIGR